MANRVVFSSAFCLVLYRGRSEIELCCGFEHVMDHVLRYTYFVPDQDRPDEFGLNWPLDEVFMHKQPILLTKCT